MDREYTEVSMTIDGKSVPLFSGDVEIGDDGTCDRIFVRGFNGNEICLDFDALNRKRHELQKIQDWQPRPISELMRRDPEFFFKLALFQLLAPALERHFEHDIDEMFASRGIREHDANAAYEAY